MAHIYRRKNTALYYSCRKKQHNSPLGKHDYEFENVITSIKHDLQKVLSEMNISQALYEGPLREGFCVRNLNIMGFGCPTSSFNDPLLQIANHIHASSWEPQADQDGHSILYELHTCLMQVLILQECAKVLYNFKQNDGCVVINIYEERFKRAISHFKSWFTRKLFSRLFSPEEYFVLLHAYISHRRKTLFELDYQFPKTKIIFTRILLWSGGVVEDRDIEWMQTTKDWRWGGYIREKFYADEINDGCYSLPRKMEKNYRVGLKEDCVVVKVLPNEKDIVWWHAGVGGKQTPCPNCRAYSKRMGMPMELMSSRRIAKKFPLPRGVLLNKFRKPMSCNCYRGALNGTLWDW